MDNYCVYLHKDADGIVRYIGSGTIIRANRLNSKSGRGVNYTNFVNLHGKLTPYILYKNLSKVESIRLEKEAYFQYFSESLLNIKVPSGEKEYPSKEKLEELFELDQTSNSGLRWKVDRTRGIRKGDTSGTLSTNGYYAVGINSEIFLCHRIIQIMLGVDIAGKVVDHVNNQRHDNSISNLRVVNQSDNMQNRSMLRNNTSGINGVRYCQYSNKWVAQMRFNNRRFTKSFSVEKYGNDTAMELALSARLEFERKYVESSTT